MFGKGLEHDTGQGPRHTYIVCPEEHVQLLVAGSFKGTIKALLDVLAHGGPGGEPEGGGGMT
ncbi:putative transcriptional regulator [Desulfovibrio ferrophilus]|uniref:Putative transcriptional regulator n=1 Tax=Desulfovibrio ferrophilus TaxID=241368 RepID=A0A2Z6AY45_9BACT|nr:putative transcriptional regulator [Desulfovibrio ferrophilus]